MKIEKFLERQEKVITFNCQETAFIRACIYSLIDLGGLDNNLESIGQGIIKKISKAKVCPAKS